MSTFVEPLVIDFSKVDKVAPISRSPIISRWPTFLPSALWTCWRDSHEEDHAVNFDIYDVCGNILARRVCGFPTCDHGMVEQLEPSCQLIMN